MDTQQLFDRIVNHLVSQGEPAGRYNPEYCQFNCFYRGTGTAGQTTMCAVGCLISDEVYASHWDSEDEVNTLENLPASDESVREAVLRSNEVFPDTPQVWTLLHALQGAHDTAARNSLAADNTIDKEDFIRRLFREINHVALVERLTLPESIKQAYESTKVAS